MLRKTVSICLALGLLSACTMNPESYKVGTKNGEDYYDFDVMGTISSPFKNHLETYSKQMCPHSYRMVGAKLDRFSRAPGVGNYWWDVTIACPAR